MQQEASQRATDGPQPERSDTEEFQAEGREGGKVPGGRVGGETEEGGSQLRSAVKECSYMYIYSDISDHLSRQHFSL